MPTFFGQKALQSLKCSPTRSCFEKLVANAAKYLWIRTIIDSNEGPNIKPTPLVKLLLKFIGNVETN